MGRPSELTPELQAVVCEVLREGNTRPVASVCAGVDYRTFKRWLKRGREEKDGAYVTFVTAVKEAETAAARWHLNNIREAARGGQLIERKTVTRKDGTEEVTEKFAGRNWYASAWFMERKFQQTWGRDARRIADLEKQVRELLILSGYHGPVGSNGAGRQNGNGFHGPDGGLPAIQN